MLYIAADHRGFKLKEIIKAFLIKKETAAEDMGDFSYDEENDYTDFARNVAEEIMRNSGNKGILLCGSGHGMDITANKYKGVRAALCFNRQMALESRAHEDANVLVLPADWISDEQALEIVEIWLAKSFSGEERHIRRLGKIREIEEKNFKQNS